MHRPRWMTIRYALIAGAVVTLVTGYIGWGQYDASLSISERAFNTLNLLFLNYNAAPPPPLLLDFARWLGVVVTSGTLIKVSIQAIGRSRELLRAIRSSEHTVVVGAGPDAIRLARSLQDDGQHVVLVGSPAEPELAELHAHGVLVVSAQNPKTLSRVLHGAEQVIVRAPSDMETARLAEHLESSQLTPGCPVRVVFQGRDFTDHWNRRTGEITALCSSTQLALALLRRCPPRLHDAVAADPILIAEGSDGIEIVRRMVLGWQEPGQAMRVEVIGEEFGWAQDAAASLGQRIDLHEHQVRLTPETATHEVQRVLAEWVAPPEDRGTPGGAAVIVALADPTRAIPLASSIAAADPGVRVCVLVERLDRWHERLVGGNKNLVFVARRDALCDLEVLSLGPVELLRDELLIDASHWPDDLGTVFGRLTRGRDGEIRVGDQATDCRLAIERVASTVENILTAGNVELTPVQTRRDEFILLNPDELSAMADQIQAVLPESLRTAASRQTALELASRLPVLVARAGWTPQRRAGRNDLTEAQINELARLAHERYLETVRENNNATNSPAAEQTWEELSTFNQASNRAQVVGIPVKLAAAGLTWRRSEHPEPYEFSDDQVLELAKMEHRRWAYFQICNGRAAHTFNRAWTGLDDGEKNLDRAPVILISTMLERCHLEITPA